MRRTMPFTQAGFRALAADQTIERRRMAYFALREDAQQQSIAAWKKQYDRVMHGIIEQRTLTWRMGTVGRLAKPAGDDLWVSLSRNANEELEALEDAALFSILEARSDSKEK